MKPNVRRIMWMLVVASLALSGLSACTSASLFGAGAGLGFAGIVTALLLLFGTATQTGCSTHACLSIVAPDDGGLDACLSPQPPDAQVGPCLGVDALAPMPDVGPCLSQMPPDADLGPCLSPPLPKDASLGPCLDVEPPDAHVGPCLSPPAPDTGVGVCLSIEPPDAGVGPCLSPPPPDASADARDARRSTDSAVAAADRQQVLERLQDRLPADVKDRLGLKKV